MQKIRPATSRNPAETNPMYTAPPGSFLLLSGTIGSKKLEMISLVYHDVGIKPKTPARTKQMPPAKAVRLFVSRSPPNLVHFMPAAAMKMPKAAKTQESTMVVRATWM